MSPHLVVFPPGVVDGGGRRLRVGSHVAFRLDGVERDGEVIGWGGPARGLEIDLSDPPYAVPVQPVDVRRLDSPHDDPVSVGWRVIDPDPTPTLLVVPIGSRDIQRVDPESDLGPFPTDGAPGPHASGASPFREWSARTADVLDAMSDSDAAEQMSQYLDMPMLRRVLDEASLPTSVARLAFVVTDQDPPHIADSVHVPRLARRWLAARGHLDPPESAPERAVLAIGEPIAVRRAPHILDAVFHQIAVPVAEAAEGCGRVAVVIAGGTPAMTYGALLAASRAVGQNAVRTIQVPAPHRSAGQVVDQPLIELDLSDTVMGDE